MVKASHEPVGVAGRSLRPQDRTVFRGSGLSYLSGVVPPRPARGVGPWGGPLPSVKGAVLKLDGALMMV